MKATTHAPFAGEVPPSLAACTVAGYWTVAVKGSDGTWSPLDRGPHGRYVTKAEGLNVARNALGKHHDVALLNGKGERVHVPQPRAKGGAS